MNEKLVGFLVKSMKYLQKGLTYPQNNTKKIPVETNPLASRIEENNMRIAYAIFVTSHARFVP